MNSLGQGNVVAGRYRLERAIARGGMGSIWVARHQQLDVDVAVKLMAPQFAASAEARVRFEREAKACALLKSANAVQIYDYGVEGDVPFIVMELLDGEDLDARLRREKRLAPAVAFGILEQACRALRRAHEMGLVHRDLKPANLFLARQSGGEEIVKVLDFGIAKAQGTALAGDATKTGSLLGSPHYMSPEQVRSSARVDHRTDVWALGVIAFQCLTGRLPFAGDEIGEVLIEVCTAPLPRPSSLAPELGAEVDQFFERALARPLESRFQSVDALLAAFAHIAGGGPAQTRVGPSPAAVPGPGAQLAAPVMQGSPVGTLSPSEHTHHGVHPAHGGGRAWIALALACVAAAIGLAAVVLVRPSDHHAAAATSAGLDAAPANVPPPLASTAPPASVAPGERVPAPTATASPSASASSRAPARAPVRNTPGTPRKPDDLLNHM